MNKRRAKKAIRKALGLRRGRICPKEVPVAQFARYLFGAVAKALNLPFTMALVNRSLRKYNYAQGRRDYEAYRRLALCNAGREALA